MIVQWVEFAAFVLAWPLVAVTDVLCRRYRGSDPRRETHREAVARYGRHGYEALHAPTDVLPQCGPDTSPLTKPTNRFRLPS